MKNPKFGCLMANLIFLEEQEDLNRLLCPVEQLASMHILHVCAALCPEFELGIEGMGLRHSLVDHTKDMKK